MAAEGGVASGQDVGIQDVAEPLADQVVGDVLADVCSAELTC